MKFLVPFTFALSIGSAVGDSERPRTGLRQSKRGLSKSRSPQHRVLLDDVSRPHLNVALIPPSGSDLKGTARSFPPGSLPGESRLPGHRFTKDTTSPAGESKQPAWPHQESDIPLDPAIKYGELENGLRYYVRPNQAPGMELRLHIDAGANFEAEEERGMAHFLEHMMFQTLEHWPQEGELIRAFQRQGIGFGSHLNAYTNLQETVYFLGLPQLDNETVSLGFTWMKDVMGGALLEEREIDAERGVVVSELQARDSVNSRLSKELYKWLLPNSLVSQRFVTGTEETIAGMTQDQFVEFYKKYYVPRRATLIAVGGDMNATKMVELIESTFGGLEDTGSRGEEADYGTVEEGYGLRTNVLTDNEVVGEQITMDTIRPAQYTADTQESRMKAIAQSMSNGILSNRLSEMGTQENSVIRSGAASSSNLYNFAQLTSVTVVPKEGHWRDAVGVLEKEWRRVWDHGFTQFEVNEAKARLLNGYEQAVLTQDSRSSATLAGILNGAVNGGYVISTAEENLRIATMALEAITAETLLDTFRSTWNTTDINVYLATGFINGTKKEVAAELKDLFEGSQKVPVQPIEEQESVVFAYTDFGDPGTVTSDSMVEDLAIRQLVLSNNIRVNMKQTDYQAGLISFRARFGSGQLSQPKNATFLDQFADFVLSNGGLGEHTILDLGTALAGKSVGLSFSVTEGDFVFSGASSPEDLELALQLLTANFLDPAFRDNVVAWWQDQIPTFLDSVKYSLGGTYQYQLLSWLKGGDERFTAPSEEELLAYVAKDAKDWLVPFLNNSYLEFSIIGDFNETTTLDRLLQTIGTLPARKNAPDAIQDSSRAIYIPAPQSNSFFYESKLPQAGAWVAWEIPSDVAHDIELYRQMSILGAVFRDRMRLKIREELGGAYSPSAGATMSDAFDYGFFVASSQGLPEEVQVFTNIILDIAANITTGDITEDEFTRALLPFQSRLVDSSRDNGYWLSVMDHSSSETYRLDWARGREAFYEALTVEQINDLAIQYLLPDLAFPLSIFPINTTTAVVAKQDGQF